MLQTVFRNFVTTKRVANDARESLFNKHAVLLTEQKH